MVAVTVVGKSWGAGAGGEHSSMYNHVTQNFRVCFLSFWGLYCTDRVSGVSGGAWLETAGRMNSIGWTLRWNRAFWPDSGRHHPIWIHLEFCRTGRYARTKQVMNDHVLPTHSNILDQLKYLSSGSKATVIPSKSKRPGWWEVGDFGSTHRQRLHWNILECHKKLLLFGGLLLSMFFSDRPKKGLPC